MNVSLDWSIADRLTGALDLVGETLVLTSAWRPDELPEAAAIAAMRRGLEAGILRASTEDAGDLDTLRGMLLSGTATWA